MTADLIEEVARALFESLEPEYQFSGTGGWDGPIMGNEGRKRWKDMARVAIKIVQKHSSQHSASEQTAS